MRRQIQDVGVALVEPTVDAECLTTEVFGQIRASLPFIAAAVKAAGFRCRVFCEELLDLDRRLPAIAREFPVVGVSVTVNTVVRAIDVARELKRARPDVLIVFGGVVACHFADRLLDAGDIVVAGRGEVILPRLLQALAAGEDLETVRGLGVRESGEIRWTAPEDGAADHPSDFDAIEGYGGFSERRNVFHLPKPPLHSVFFTTGCVNRCRFCMSERRFRTRSVENVIADVTAILDRHRTLLAPRLMLVDDCPFGDIAKFRELLEALASLRRARPFSVMMQFHVKPLAKHEDLPGLLVDAGVTTLLIGFETVSDRSLEAENKGTTVADNLRAIEICRRAGIVPYGYFVVGFETDTPEVVGQVFRFIEEHRLVAQVLPVGVTEARPGARGTETTMTTLDPFSFGATIFVSHRHPEMGPRRLQELLIEGYDRIFALSRIIGLPSMRERVYQLAFWAAYRKWRPRLIAHLSTLDRAAAALDREQTPREGGGGACRSSP